MSEDTMERLRRENRELRAKGRRTGELVVELWSNMDERTRLMQSATLDRLLEFWGIE